MVSVSLSRLGLLRYGPWFLRVRKIKVSFGKTRSTVVPGENFGENLKFYGAKQPERGSHQLIINTIRIHILHLLHSLFKVMMKTVLDSHLRSAAVVASTSASTRRWRCWYHFDTLWFTRLRMYCPGGAPGTYHIATEEIGKLFGDCLVLKVEERPRWVLVTCKQGTRLEKWSQL